MIGKKDSYFHIVNINTNTKFYPKFYLKVLYTSKISLMSREYYLFRDTIAIINIYSLI